MAQSQVAGTHCVWKLMFWSFLYTKTRPDQAFPKSQVIFMAKFSPTELNLDYDFVLLVHFLGTYIEYLLVSLFTF